MTLEVAWDSSPPAPREAARRVSKPPLAFRGGNPGRRVEDELP
jgi:hypothetical protein